MSKLSSQELQIIKSLLSNEDLETVRQGLALWEGYSEDFISFLLSFIHMKIGVVNFLFHNAELRSFPIEVFKKLGLEYHWCDHGMISIQRMKHKHYIDLWIRCHLCGLSKEYLLESPKVLSKTYTDLSAIPENIDEWETLQTMSFLHCPIETIPESILNLKNLRTLEFVRPDFKELPKFLINQHINILFTEFDKKQFCEISHIYKAKES